MTLSVMSMQHNHGCTDGYCFNRNYTKSNDERGEEENAKICMFRKKNRFETLRSNCLCRHGSLSKQK